jgi:hypothetical protein
MKTGQKVLCVLLTAPSCFDLTEKKVLTNQNIESFYTAPNHSFIMYFFFVYLIENLVFFGMVLWKLVLLDI